MIDPRSQTMDSVLYHQYLKSQNSPCDIDSICSDSVVSPVVCEDPSKPSAYHWDLPETSKPLLPAFNYISQKLALEGLSIHLIVSAQAPFIIPVWNLPLQSQITLCRIVRKACKKYGLAPSWMTALASLSKKDLAQVFEANTPDAYIVRRSMLQREIIYTAEGLTLLSIDHIYTLKQLLCTLSKPDWVSTSREVCLTSCVHLLHRIHSVYTGKPASARYVERVYREVPFQEARLEEVVASYNASYCTASIYKVAFQPEFISQEKSATFLPCGLPELSSTTTAPDCSVGSNDDTLVSPLLDVDLSTLCTWNVEPVSQDYDTKSVPSVTYPIIKKPSPPTRSTASRSTSASPELHRTIANHTFPLPPSHAPSYPLPPPPSSPLHSTPISSLGDDGWIFDPPPSPLRINKAERASADTLLAPSAFGDAVESAVDGEFLWELNVLESPRSYIESWSKATASALCERCYDIVSPISVRGVTME